MNNIDTFNDFDNFDDTDISLEENEQTAEDVQDSVDFGTSVTETFSTDNTLVAFDDFGIEELGTSIEGSDTSTEVSDTSTEEDFDIELAGSSEETNPIDSLTAEDTWTTDTEIEADNVLNQELVDNTVDKNSFDSLFSSTPTPVSSGVKTSILNNGACDTNAFALEYININNIIVWQPRIRSTTDVSALITSIKNDGLLQPLVVAPTKTEGRYVLIKGARRLIACAKLGMKNIPCVINKQITNSDIHVVEPLYSHNKPYSISEMLGYISYLKKEKNIDTPSMIEYLLNLPNGHYMKLMDVMDDNDDEIVSALLTGELDIAGAYKKLEQKRKKAGRDKMADARTQRVYGNASSGTDITANSGETNIDGESLSDDEITDIVNSLEDVSNIDGEELKKEGEAIKGFEPHKQDPNNRERLDPKLRKAVLARDNNTCQICGLSGMEYLEALDIHHIAPVFLSGVDDINNLLCTCVVCHKLIHLWSRGELNIRPFDQMNEAEAQRFKRIIKLGNVIRKGMAEKGMKKEQLKKVDNAETIGRTLKGSSEQVAD